jgi:hypothetical protein
MGWSGLAWSVRGCANCGVSVSIDVGGGSRGGDHVVAAARPGGTGSFDQMLDIANPPANNARTTPKLAVIILIFMLPPQFFY